MNPYNVTVVCAYHASHTMPVYVPGHTHAWCMPHASLTLILVSHLLACGRLSSHISRDPSFVYVSFTRAASACLGSVFSMQIAPTSTSTVQVKRYSGAVHVCTQQMISDRWAPTAGRTRDLYADFNQLTLDITLAAVFGQDLSRSSLVCCAPPPESPSATFLVLQHVTASLVS